MKAARLHARGGPEAVVVEEAPKPVPRAGEVRVRVEAAALTPGELTWDKTYQHPDGSRRIPTIPGHDVVGKIDAVGPGAPQELEIRIGQRVYGLIDFPFDGSAAEYAILPAGDVAPAPRSIDSIQAAAIPLSALTAWQALFDHGHVSGGQRVLIHGGAGGVGAWAVQLAHYMGAIVSATTSTANLKLVRELGANVAIDYTAQPVEQMGTDYDLVFDTVGGETLERSLPLVRRGGAIVSIAGIPDSAKCSAVGIRCVFFIVRPDRKQLIELASLVDAGRVKVNVQEVFPLDHARSAFERTVAGHLRGKIVLQVEELKKR